MSNGLVFVMGICTWLRRFLLVENIASHRRRVTPIPSDRLSEATRSVLSRFTYQLYVSFASSDGNRMLFEQKTELTAPPAPHEFDIPLPTIHPSLHAVHMLHVDPTEHLRK